MPESSHFYAQPDKEGPAYFTLVSSLLDDTARVLVTREPSVAAALGSANAGQVLKVTTERLFAAEGRDIRHATAALVRRRGFEETADPLRALDVCEIPL